MSKNLPALPSLVFTPEQCEKIVNAPTIITKEAGDRLIENILAEGLLFHGQLWSRDLKERAKNIRYMKKHPEEFRTRERSAMLFIRMFSKKEEDNGDPRDITPGRMTVERLRDMGLNNDQIKQIAGIEEEEK